MAEELVPIQKNEYNELLLQTVAVIENARINIARHIAASSSNTYWKIGRLLYERKLESKHGSGVVKRLSVDLKERYPDMGLSPRQLWNMKSFYVRYKDCDEKLLRSVALLPWSQNLLLLNKDLSDGDTLYYAKESIAKGWNRDLLLNAIKLGMHETHSVPSADNNFESTLPAVQTQYANEVFHSTSPFSTAPSVRKVRNHPLASSFVPRKTVWMWSWHLRA
jgi:predicted nuclease of restriction endonuclease-like (RecB) superfamily